MTEAIQICFLSPKVAKARTAGKYYWRGKLSTVHLLVLISLDLLLFILKMLYTLFTKQATLMKGSVVLSLPPQLVFPAKMFLYCQSFPLNGELHISGPLNNHIRQNDRIDPNLFSITLGGQGKNCREVLLEGRAQYSSSPYTN